ncbi:hypothetical protein J1N35_038103 [Gossypium stocksii]|uniref:Uncharacterized protein n=1 Tax=Gossypium stocksii TaxID=47602 RepID=A0A9D3UM10_9ROSI|nr:hypothetical protein J1N35_038103 [Gossypium stocksii]
MNIPMNFMLAMSHYEDDNKDDNLRLKVSKIEKILEETTEELTRKKAEWQNLIKENEEMVNHYRSMAEDKDGLQKEILEAKGILYDLRAKMVYETNLVITGQNPFLSSNKVKTNLLTF